MISFAGFGCSRRDAGGADGASASASAKAETAEAEDKDYPGLAGDFFFKKVVTDDGGLKMALPRAWVREKAAAPAVLRLSGGPGPATIGIDSRPVIREDLDLIEAELNALGRDWQARGYTLEPELRKAVSAGGVPFYMRKGGKPGRPGTLIYGLLMPKGLSAHYYLYTVDFPIDAKSGNETLAVVNSIRLAK